MRILDEYSVQMKGRKRRYCNVLCDCGNVFRFRKDKIRDDITCRKCHHLKISKRSIKHGMFSKHFKNEELAACFTKCSLMTWRSYSEAHPTYKGICFGLDIKRNTALECALNLYELLGAPPEGKSIEKEPGGYYWCGRCVECAINNWHQTLIGYVAFDEQQLTKKTTNLLKYKEKYVALSSLGNAIDINQSVINYLFYSKYKHIPKQDRWFYVNQELIEKKNCSECRRLEMVNY